VPIPGSKRRTYLEEHVAGAAAQLKAAQMSLPDDALAPGTVAGKRHPDSIMATMDR